MAYDTNQGMGKLAAVLDDRMTARGSSPQILDFGEILGDYSLLPNTFPIPIPAKDYMVCGGLWGRSFAVSGGSHGGHTAGFGEHSHGVTAPVMKPGDRVLLAWVQEEAVVIDVIKKASSI